MASDFLNGIISPFFHNKTAKQTVFKNTFWLGLSSAISRLMTFFLFVYVARILGATQYGEFNFALSFVILFSIFSDLGLSKVIIRELSQDKEKEKEYPNLLSLKIFLLGASLITVFLSSFFVTQDHYIRNLIWILAFYIGIGNFFNIFYAFLQARQKMEYEAAAKILETVFYVGAGFLVIFNFPSAKNLAIGYFVSIFAFLFLFLIFFHSRIFRLNLGWNTGIWKKYLGISWPLALTAVFSSVYSQTDTVMLGSSGQITQVGWYQAAYRIIAATLIPATIISTSFFPMLNRAFKESKEKFQRIWNFHTESMVYLAIPLVVGGIILAPRIIDYIFNPTFGPSVLAFQILIITAGLTILQTPFYHSLIVCDQQKKIFYAVLAGAIFNVILNWILIPRYSLYGAAWATVITLFLIVSVIAGFVRKSTSIRPFNKTFFLSILLSAISVIPMYFTIIQPGIYNLNVILSVLAGAGVYFVFLYFLRKFFNKLT